MEQGLDDIWGCVRWSTGKILRNNLPCGALPFWIGNNNLYTWRLSNYFAESAAVSKVGPENGGVMCCKNFSSVCSSSQYRINVDSGCADGTREWLVDRSLYPDIAGCSGGFNIGGILDSTQTTFK